MTQKFSKKDPYLKREKKKYADPICSRELILSYIEFCKNPVSDERIISGLAVRGAKKQLALSRRLQAMFRDGQLIKNKQGFWTIPDDSQLISGYVQAAKEGYGFLIRDDGGNDIYLSNRQMRQVFNEDRVLIREQARQRGQRTEGIIVKVLEHKTTRLVGRYLEEAGIAYIEPFDAKIHQDIWVLEGGHGHASHGDYVEAIIHEQPTKRRRAIAKVKKVLGDQLTPGLEVELAIRAHQLPFTWPRKIKESLAKLPNKLLKKDYINRKDSRHLRFVTIDGQDAKDFDDAIFCRSTTKGWRLHVAIADVSHYVKPGTCLDEEALMRGNSVYFPGQVIPMLPEKLSNGLCSLVPNQDRLVFMADMLIDENGDIYRTQFYKSVIHSRARLTYDQVNDHLKKGASLGEQLEEVERDLLEAFSCYKVLKKNRKKRGAIDFDVKETKILMTPLRKIKTIMPTSRHDAHCMIEEFMLAANQAVAQFLIKKKVPALFREHLPPDPIKLLALKDFLKALGLRLPGKVPTSKAYCSLLERVKDRKDAHLIQTVLLRSLSQAVYTPESTGHFGLAYDAYCQFTSPIRRYPDLIVHRALDAVIEKKSKPLYAEEALLDFGEHCSFTERRADLATREAVSWLKCHYMLDKIGQAYAGVITQVTSFGFFVELSDIFVEGLCHISQLPDDRYQFDAPSYTLFGRCKQNKFQLGDNVRVVLSHIDLVARKIDFCLENTPGKKDNAIKKKSYYKKNKKKSASTDKKSLNKKNQRKKNKKKWVSY